MNFLQMRRWSPYAVGAGIGLLSWFAFATADKPIGITTAFEYSAALAIKPVAPALVQPYLDNKAKDQKSPKIDWEWMLVAGVFVGAFLSSQLSGDRAPQEKVPHLWSRRFGPRTGVRFAGAFIGGFLIMFGARIAQGCTSGHGISGSLQLAVASWIFVPLMFATAIGVAFLLYGKEGSRHV